MIEYWHWHTLHFGTETYWGGDPSAQRPARAATYRGARPARRGVGRRRRARRRPRPRTPTSRWSTRCRASGSCRSTRRWRPPDGGPDAARLPRASSIPSTAAPSTPAGRCASSTPGSCSTRAVSGRPAPESAARRTPSWSSRRCTSPTTRRSTGSAAYAAAGGHLVLGPRTGYADHEARARPELDARTARRGRRRPVRRVQQPDATTSRSVPPRTARRSTCRTDAAATRWADGLTSWTPILASTTTRTSAAGRPSPPAATARAGSPASARYRHPPSPKPSSMGRTRRVRGGGTPRPGDMHRRDRTLTAAACASYTTGPSTTSASPWTTRSSTCSATST